MSSSYRLPRSAWRSLDEQSAVRLTGRYGVGAADIVERARSADLVVIPDTNTLWAELPWCAANERVQHLDDLLLRRTRLGLLLHEGGAEHFDRIRELVQTPLGWSDERWAQECVRYKEIWRQHYSVPA